MAWRKRQLTVSINVVVRGMSSGCHGDRRACLPQGTRRHRSHSETPAPSPAPSSSRRGLWHSMPPWCTVCCIHPFATLGIARTLIHLSLDCATSAIFLSSEVARGKLDVWDKDTNQRDGDGFEPSCRTPGFGTTRIRTIIISLSTRRTRWRTFSSATDTVDPLPPIMHPTSGLRSICSGVSGKQQCPWLLPQLTGRR